MDSESYERSLQLYQLCKEACAAAHSDAKDAEYAAHNAKWHLEQATQSRRIIEASLFEGPFGVVENRLVQRNSGAHASEAHTIGRLTIDHYGNKSVLLSGGLVKFGQAYDFGKALEQLLNFTPPQQARPAASSDEEEMESRIEEGLSQLSLQPPGPSPPATHA